MKRFVAQGAAEVVRGAASRGRALPGRHRHARPASRLPRLQPARRAGAARAEAGFTPLEALRTATLRPARFLGWEKDLGTVEQGKLADLVLLDADPLADIANTRKIRAVVAGGRYFSREDLDALLRGVEARAEGR